MYDVGFGVYGKAACGVINFREQHLDSICRILSMLVKTKTPFSYENTSAFCLLNLLTSPFDFGLESAATGCIQGASHPPLESCAKSYELEPLKAVSETKRQSWEK